MYAKRLGMNPESLNTTFFKSIAFQIALAWHNCSQGADVSMSITVHERALGPWICFLKASWNSLWNNCHPNIRLYRGTSHWWDARELAARSFDLLAPSAMQMATILCLLLSICSDGILRRFIDLRNNMLRQPAWSFHFDDEALLKLA